MKKRTIKQQAREAEKKILEENQKWFNAFIQENYPGYKEQQKKQKVWTLKLKKMWISIGSSMAAATAIVLSLIFTWPLMFPTLPPPGPDPNPPKKYFAENEIFTPSNLTELNSNLKGFLLELDIGYEGDINRIYDSVSEDTLYYLAEFIKQETFEIIAIYIYVNPDYEVLIDLLDETEKTSINNFTVRYHKDVLDDDWPLILIYRAISEYNDFTIYIEYEQWSANEESNFFNFFEQTFQVI